MRTRFSSQGWYYKQNGQTVGPVSVAHLRELLTTGQLRHHQVVWQAGDQRLLYVRVTTVAFGSGAEAFDRGAVESA